MNLPPHQRAWSVTVAMVTSAELASLALLMPRVTAASAGFGANPNWLVPSFSWSWCIPVAVLLSAWLIAKDIWYRPVVAGRINLVVFWTGLLLWGACMSILVRSPIYTLPEIISPPPRQASVSIGCATRGKVSSLRAPRIYRPGIVFISFRRNTRIPDEPRPGEPQAASTPLVCFPT